MKWVNIEHCQTFLYDVIEAVQANCAWVVNTSFYHPAKL